MRVFGHRKYQAISTVEPINDEYDNNRGSDPNGAINQTIPIQDLLSEVFVDVGKSLKWRLNVRLLARLWVMFILNFLDRVHTLIAHPV